jgi:hypothetical protein
VSTPRTERSVWPPRDFCPNFSTNSFRGRNEGPRPAVTQSPSFSLRIPHPRPGSVRAESHGPGPAAGGPSRAAVRRVAPPAPKEAAAGVGSREEGGPGRAEGEGGAAKGRSRGDRRRRAPTRGGQAGAAQRPAGRVAGAGRRVGGVGEHPPPGSRFRAAAAVAAAAAVGTAPPGSLVGQKLRAPGAGRPGDRCGPGLLCLQLDVQGPCGPVRGHGAAGLACAALPGILPVMEAAATAAPAGLCCAPSAAAAAAGDRDRFAVRRPGASEREPLGRELGPV